MVVQHNLQAMNSNRMLGITQGTLSGSTEKLSSGYKVNRAADDAAGLSISEKMRKQIRGLTRASANAEDGISAVQTAEGALAEVHDMLQRMNELAVQASNGTNSESDRQTIQDEVDQLLTEIDRVSETTKFNEIYLLKGNAEGTSSDIYVNAHDAGIKGKLVDNGGATASFKLDKALEDGDEITIAGEQYTIGNKGEKVSTDGYAKYDTADDDFVIDTTTLSAGDKITYAPGGKTNAAPEDYKTAVMTEKFEHGEATDYKKGMEFTIEDEEGHKKTYVIDDNPAQAGADGKETETAQGIVNVIKKAFEAGHKVTMTKYSDGTEKADVNWEVVKKLEDGEVAANDWHKFVGTAAGSKTLQAMNVNEALAIIDDSGTAVKPEEIKSVTLDGETTTFTTEKPISASDIAKAVGMMKSGDKLSITDVVDVTTTTVTTITIADVTDAKKNEYTIEDALKLINVSADDMDTIEFDLKEGSTTGRADNRELAKFLKSLKLAFNVEGKAPADTKEDFDTTYPVKATVVGDVSQDGNDDVISASSAYKKIAEALKQASSIGADEGKEAEVKNNEDGTFDITKGSTTAKDALGFNLHVGADADMTNKIGVKIDTMDTKGLGIQKLDVVGKDSEGAKIDDGGIAATYAIDAISDAISKVSAQRSLLGAVQNRLDHTIKNLDNVVENTTAAESQIRDTDMATEMVTYSNANILAQAGQSMLAQANQSNQGVLSLLG